ncbi:hypothetical protein F4604DRAFT_1681106 [Suillus subluteus]|nr:hypothetical protein F4604DRAFT_1681106 [Suillus subluteus]
MSVTKLPSVSAKASTHRKAVGTLGSTSVKGIVIVDAPRDRTFNHGVIIDRRTQLWQTQAGSAMSLKIDLCNCRDRELKNPISAVGAFNLVLPPNHRIKAQSCAGNVSNVVMHNNHESVGSLGAEDHLISLRRQINEIKEHIDLLMMQSAIIRERRCLIQHQQDITPLVITEQLESTSAEISSVDILDIKPETSQDSTVSGPYLALKGAADFPASRPRSKSIVLLHLIQDGYHLEDYPS